MSISHWQKRDLQVNWHPYVQHQTAPTPIVIVRGKGSILWDENGKEYIDAIASWWCNPHGHANPKIANAISEQLKQLEHVLFGGFSHPTAIELSEKLLAILPSNQTKIFYSDNGSTAVEVAVKMALQYHFNQGHRKKTIVAFEGAFHGDTFAAMAVSGIGFFTEAFADLLIDVKRVPIPTQKNKDAVLEQIQAILSKDDVAAFIFEPLVLGAAGMQIYEPQLLDQCIDLCRQAGVLCIADEVMTGFGRTGTIFAIDQLQNAPDLVCLSKALTGGFIPLAVTSCTQNIFNAFLSHQTEKAFFHGHTFMANPAGCAAALASLELTFSAQSIASREAIEKSHHQFAEKIKNAYQIKNLQIKGVILRFELDTPEENYYGDLRNSLYQFFIDNGVILRPVGNVIYLLPPYCITKDQLQKVYDTIEKAMQHFGFVQKAVQ